MNDNTFDAACELSAWLGEVNALQQIGDTLGGLKPDLWRLDREMKDCEVTIIANGGDAVTGATIDGKNAEIREAQLINILSGIPHYANMTLERDRIKGQITALEYDRESILEKLRRHRGAVAYYESENLLQAAIAGAPHTKES